MKLTSLVAVVTVLLSVPSHADTILVFGQSTGTNLFTGNETAGVTVLDSNNVPVTITTLNSVGVNVPAFFNLDATSTGPATNVSGSLWTQQYTGGFQVTGGMNGTGFNFLSGLFTGVQLGIVGGNSMVFGSSSPPLSLSFTSSVVGMPLTPNPAMALSLTNVLPIVAISNNSFADFSSNVSGTFSAITPQQVIPEPSTMILLMSGLVVVSRRRRARGSL